MTEEGTIWEKNPGLIDRVWGSAMIGITLPEVSRKLDEFKLWGAALSVSRTGEMYNYYEERSDVEGGIERFKKVCDATQKFWNQAQEINPTLYQELVKARDRKGGGKNEPENVPASFADKVTPVATPWGWAIPRLDLEVGVPAEELLKESLKKSETPEELLGNYAERLLQTKSLGIEKIMDFLLKKHIMEEQNNQGMYFEVIDAIAKNNKELMGVMILAYSNRKKDTEPPGWVSIMTDYSKRLS
jgi:hypothetical protein